MMNVKSWRCHIFIGPVRPSEVDEVYCKCATNLLIKGGLTFARMNSESILGGTYSSAVTLFRPLHEGTSRIDNLIPLVPSLAQNWTP